MYNNLNALHPHQPNLTKSLEFKNWQRRINGLPEDTYYKERNPVNNITYHNIVVETDSARNDEYDQSETTNTATPENIPQENIHTTDLMATPENIPQENIHTTDLTNDAIIQACPNKVMCLEIPLIKVPPKQPSEKTTLSEVHEEIIDQGQANRDNFDDIEPSVLDVIPPETMDEMIYQLQDTDLAAIMNSMDIMMNVEVGSSTSHENPQHDEFGLDIDIDVEEEDPFENELNNIIW